MTMITTTYPLARMESPHASAATTTQSRPWAFWGTLGWFGVAMVVLSLALIAHNLMRPKPGNEPARAVAWQAAGRALGTWAAFAVAVALMWPLGFVLSFVLFTFVIVAVVFRRPFATAAVTAVVAALAFYVVFPVVLDVQLPTGVLGF